MSKLIIYDMKGDSRGEMEVADDLLVLDRGQQAVHDTVVAHRAASRAGTASTLRKGEVAGSNKKPWRQKGTGQARAGYRQSPIWRGGGVAFGPHPRRYIKKLTKKTRQLAFRHVLSEKIAEGAIKVLDRLELSEAKTKLFGALLKSLDIKGAALIVLDMPDRKVLQAARNVPHVEVATANNLNTYQMLRYPVIVANKAAMDQLKERLMRTAGEGS